MLSETDATLAAMALLRDRRIDHSGVLRILRVRLGAHEVAVLRRYGVPASICDRWSVIFAPPPGRELLGPEELLVAVDTSNGAAWLVSSARIGGGADGRSLPGGAGTTSLLPD